jgi:hypothetical protein
MLALFTIVGAATSRIDRKIFAVDTEKGADSFPLSLDPELGCGLDACTGTIVISLGRDEPPGVYSHNSTLHIVSSAANKSAARLSRSLWYRCRSWASTPLRGRQSGYVHVISEVDIDGSMNKDLLNRFNWGNGASKDKVMKLEAPLRA